MSPPAAEGVSPWPGALVNHPRLFVCAALSIAAFFITPSAWPLATRALAAWNVGALAYFAAVAVMMSQATGASIRARAQREDESDFAILVVSVAAATASLVAIIGQLAVVKDMHGLERGQHIALAVLTIVSAWSFIHLMFALHYAHTYFQAQPNDTPTTADDLRGGLRFPGTPTPDYRDFLYFSFVIGVASQTADVELTSREMRRISLGHSIVSFFFNTTLLALTINIAAGLV